MAAKKKVVGEAAPVVAPVVLSEEDKLAADEAALAKEIDGDVPVAKLESAPVVEKETKGVKAIAATGKFEAIEGDMFNEFGVFVGRGADSEARNAVSDAAIKVDRINTMRKLPAKAAARNL